MEQFSKQTIGWHRDPRCRALKHPAYKWLNAVLWALCVEHRTETLPKYIKATDIAYESGIDVRTVRKGLAFMSTQMQPLIKILDNGQIHVYGVRAMHETPKFPFKSTNDTDEDINEGTDEDISEDINVYIDAPKSEDREEKSREEKKRKEKKGYAPTTDLEKSMFEIYPDMGNKIPSLIKNWLDTYPNIDILKNVKDARNWDDTQKKPKKDKARFLNNWFKNGLGFGSLQFMAGGETKPEPKGKPHGAKFYDHESETWVY